MEARTCYAAAFGSMDDERPPDESAEHSKFHSAACKTERPFHYITGAPKHYDPGPEHFPEGTGFSLVECTKVTCECHVSRWRNDVVGS